MSVIVTGSVAFDHIMRFPGYFKDHILPDKIHMLNVSFLVDSLKRQRGGTGGNIAYSCALLGLTPRLVAAAGGDFGPYGAELEAIGVRTDAITVFEDDFCPSGFITTDNADNQLTGFYQGAMRHAGERSLHDVLDAAVELAIFSSDDPAAMRRHPRECREAGVPYIYDPGWGLPVLSGEDLVEGLIGARVLIGNDYELAVIENKTGLGRDALRERVELIITTLGERGAEIDARGEIVTIPAARVTEMVDPTGAGDAFRGGLILGLTRGFPLEVTGRLAALAGAYAVEHLGTQQHRYTPAEFAARFNESFPDQPPLTPELVPAVRVAGG